MRTRNFLTAAMGLLLLLPLITCSACSSVDKAVIEQRLLELPKNLPVKSLGISTHSAEVRLGGQSRAVQFSYLHIRPEVAPAGPRPTLVLVHGTPSSLFTWSELIFGGPGFSGLSQDFEIYALDLFGHGITRSDLRPATFDECAQYLAAFLTAMELSNVCLVGQSYGGEFAWRAALKQPERISHLVLMDSSGYPREADGFLSEEVAMREMWVAPIGYLLNSRERIAEALQPHFGSPVEAQRVEEIFQLCENSDNWRSMVDLVRDENGLAAGRLPEIQIPTLLIWGDRDLAYPAERDGRRFESDLPNARLRVVEDCGHYPQEERPEVVATWLRELLVN